MTKRKNTIIVDIDDCIADFKQLFFEDLRINHGLKVVKDIYPSILYSENLLTDFISREKFLSLSPNWNIISTINELYKLGYDIILVTARPRSAKSVNQTKKYNWLCKQTFYNDILFCVEDNLKHISDYIGGGLRVLSPIIPDMDYSDFILEKNFSLYQDYNFEKLITNLINES